MQKYEKHGLTNEEDLILGSFGQSPELDDTIRFTDYDRVGKYAIKSLWGKDLLKREIDSDTDETFYSLTAAGKRLYRIREQEELEGV